MGRERKKRLPWGHESRHCTICGKVGPRVVVLGGYAHRYCLNRQRPMEWKRPPSPEGGHGG